MALSLKSARTSPSGVTMNRYTPAGSVKTGSFALERPTEAEFVRREKMGQEMSKTSPEVPVAGHAQIGHDFALRTLFLSLALAALAVAGPVAQPSQRPNIVLIIMDDLGYGDLGSYGAPDAKTPNIDRLAREGVKLTDFYANHANCSPTRTGFITGRYQQRYGIESPLRAIDDARQLLPSDTSLPRLLKSAGYATGLIGKWHLGARAEAGPNRHGFDEFWGFRGGAVDYYTHNAVTTPGVKLPAPIHDLYHNEEPTRATGYLTDEITARAKPSSSSTVRRRFSSRSPTTRRIGHSRPGPT